MNINGGRGVAQAQNFVVVKIALFDAAAVHGDGAFERGSEPEINGAFHLRLDAEGIHGGAAIDGAGDAMDSNVACGRIAGDFGDLRDVAAVTKMCGDAAARALRQRLSPI